MRVLFIADKLLTDLQQDRWTTGSLRRQADRSLSTYHRHSLKAGIEVHYMDHCHHCPFHASIEESQAILKGQIQAWVLGLPTDGCSQRISASMRY